VHRSGSTDRTVARQALRPAVAFGRTRRQSFRL